MTIKRTNKDWLNSLSNEELANWLCSFDFQNLIWSFTQSDKGLEEWLGKERNETNEQ